MKSNTDRCITAYAVVDDPPRLKRATRERAWMEESTHRFAYRCLPLAIANQIGWDILNTLPFRARWNGGNRPSDVVIEPLAGAAGDQKALACAHFGEGVLTFSLGYLFRTPPGIGLLVCGPLNAPKDGISALSGLVETDWAHATFTMNYRFTRRMHWVEFGIDEPICRIIPVDRHLLDQLGGEIRPIADDLELEKQFRDWTERRAQFNDGLGNPFSVEAQQGWQRDYFQGRSASGERMPDHQTQLHHGEFLDRRPGASTTRADSSGRSPTRPILRRTRESASHYLWDNSEVYDQRRGKFAAVLAGIIRLLDENRPLNGNEDEFLECIERVRRLPPEEFTFIWSEPRAFHWVRVAFELLDHLVNDRELTALTQNYIAEIGAIGPAAAFDLHLDAFRLFELGAALAYGRELLWEKPLLVQTPCAIPGTSWTFAGSGALSLRGVTHGGLRVQFGGEEHSIKLAAGSVADTGLSLLECDCVCLGDLELRVQPEAVAGLGLAEARPPLSATPEFRAWASTVLHEALEQLAIYDGDTLRLLASESRIIAPKASDGTYSNTTFSTLPGAMVLSIVPNALEMADRIVHELHHDRLFCIEEFHTLLQDGVEDASGVDRLYSPWRFDPRPARGILHGLYVFIAVGRFWLRVLTAEGTGEKDRTFAAQRLRLTVGQLETAVAVLETGAQFTPFGSGVFDQLRRDVEALHSAADDAGVPGDPQVLTVTEEGLVVPRLSSLTGMPLSVSVALVEHRIIAGGTRPAK